VKCESCRDARANPFSAQMTNGCVSCEGRALALMNFTIEELADKHSHEVIESFAFWAPAVRQAKAASSASKGGSP
jgi:hypothetical protein